jgi:uncharacterized membrane protein YjjP (DUF1212 family)
MDATTAQSREDREFLLAADALVALAKALHHVGFPSHVIEEKIGRAAGVLGQRLDMLCLPTGMILTLFRGAQPVTYALREQPGAVNLERMTLLVRAADGLIAGKLTAPDAKSCVEQIMRSPDRWRAAATITGYVASGGAFAVFFGGGSKEVLVSIIVGLGAGILAVVMRPGRGGTRLFELAAAASAAAVAELADHVFGSFVQWIPIAAGLIILLPGISLIDAVSELSRGHLVSGGARLAGVIVVLLALAFGAVVGFSLAELVPHVSEKIESIPLAASAVIPALAVVSVGSMIRFRAAPRDLPAIIAGSALALFVARWGKDALGEAAGPFLAAMLLGLAGTLFARLSRNPPELIVIPGIALLVPGSIGIQSLSSLLAQDTAHGVAAGFEMFLVAMALVSGLLFSQAVFREH